MMMMTILLIVLTACFYLVVNAVSKPTSANIDLVINGIHACDLFL